MWSLTGSHSLGASAPIPARPPGRPRKDPIIAGCGCWLAGWLPTGCWLLNSLARSPPLRFVWRRSLARTMWDGLLQSLDFGGKTMMPIRYAVDQLTL